MSAAGAWTALVSGGFDLFTGRVAGHLGFHEHRANRLVEREGRLAGEVADPILGRAAKAAALAEICERLGISPGDAIAVGDGANDLDMLALAGTGRRHARQALRRRACKIPHRPWRPHRPALSAGLPAGRVRAMTPIETQRLVLRNWEPRDAALFHRINSDDEVMRFFPFRRTPAESAEAMERLRHGIEQDGFGFAPAEIRGSGACIGFCGINRIPFIPGLAEGTVEIGWRLAPEFWGHGYASEAGRAWLEFGFAQLGLDEIVSFAVWNNERSTAVMRRLGMRRDEAGDFDHPRIPDSTPHLKRHVLYRLSRADWESRKNA